MNPLVFNVCVLVGWALFVLGAALYSVPASLVLAGLSLVGLTCATAIMFGVVKRRAPTGIASPVEPRESDFQPENE